MEIIKVYHGSDHIVKEPLYLGGKSDNDYGNGFYTTEYEERAKKWAALNGNPAYDVCYLECMFQKHRYLFKLIARNCENVFQVITDYMNSDYRRYMDMGNPLYLNKTPKQILGNMGIRANMNADISENYDEFILEWMADIYVYLQWKYNLVSGEIVKKIKPEELYKKYYPLHEASLENGVEKLKKIYQL